MVTCFVCVCLLSCLSVRAYADMFCFVFWLAVFLVVLVWFGFGFGWLCLCVLCG